MRDVHFNTYIHTCMQSAGFGKLAPSERASLRESRENRAQDRCARLAPLLSQAAASTKQGIGFWAMLFPGSCLKIQRFLSSFKQTSSSNSSSSNNNNTTCDRIAEHWRASLRSRMQVLIQQHSNKRTSTITACAFASHPWSETGGSSCSSGGWKLGDRRFQGISLISPVLCLGFFFGDRERSEEQHFAAAAGGACTNRDLRDSPELSVLALGPCLSALTVQELLLLLLVWSSSTRWDSSSLH